MCVLCLLCNSSLPACLCLLIFPLRGVFCCSLFYCIIKRNILLCLSPRLHISSQFLTERISHLRTQQRICQQRWEALQYPSGRREDWSVRQTLLGSCSLVGDGEYLPHGHLLGRPGWAFQIPDALLGPREVAGGLHQPGSECKRLSLQGGVSCRVRSVLRAHRVCSRARSVPGAHWARSVPLAHTDSTPEPAPFCEPTQSPHQSPLRSVSPHRVRSRARSVPWAHTDSTPESATFRDPT